MTAAPWDLLCPDPTCSHPQCSEQQRLAAEVERLRNAGPCDYCSNEASTRVRVVVPAGEWENEILLWCEPCAVSVGRLDPSEVAA